MTEYEKKMGSRMVTVKVNSDHTITFTAWMNDNVKFALRYDSIEIGDKEMIVKNDSYRYIFEAETPGPWRLKCVENGAFQLIESLKKVLCQLQIMGNKAYITDLDNKRHGIAFDIIEIDQESEGPNTIETRIRSEIIDIRLATYYSNIECRLVTKIIDAQFSTVPRSKYTCE